MISWFINSIIQRSSWWLVALVIIGVFVNVVPLNRLSKSLVEDAAITDAEIYSIAIEQLRTLYTATIVNRVKKHGMTVTHNFEDEKHSIPLPVTFSMILGEKISEIEESGEIKIYSKYPFPWRENTGGLKTQFQKEAWEALSKNPNQPYYKFEEIKGKRYLQYARADLMRTACVNCHNSHKQTPKNDWRIGDLRGILQVSRPVDVILARAKTKIQITQSLTMVITAILLLLFAFVVRSQKKTQKELTLHKDNLETLVSRRTTEAEIARTEAENANKSKSLFLANMSHELRTPMHGILSYAKFGIEDINDSSKEEHLKCYHEILEAGTGLMDLLNDILDQAKLESGKMSYNKEESDLVVLIDAAISMFSSFAKEKSIELKFDPPENDASAYYDSVRISQVIRNIISNAIKFSAENSEISIEIHSNPTKNQVTISVTNTGLGIPKNELEKIFDKFAQSSKTRSGAGGTGLGLSISQDIISDHDGNIWAESDTETGLTTFSFSLPIKKIERVVLVVDDSRAQLVLVSELVKRSGFKVLSASDAEEALHILEKHKVHALITDIIMPGMDGKELAKICTEKFPKMQIAFISGALDKVEVTSSEWSSLKKIELIKKPITVKKLEPFLESIDS